MKKKARTNIYQLERKYRQEVIDTIDEVAGLARDDRSIEGIIILLTDSHGRTRVATGGRLDDRAQAVYHTSLALRWDFLTR